VRVMRTGTTIGTAQPPADLADTLAFDRPARASVPSDRQTVLTVPLPGEDGPLGVMVFATRDPDRGYEDPDVTFAEELARRVAPAVENAIRFEQEAETAETLQRSLLPERLATLPGLDVAARYLPGSRRVHVGGDWYDTLALPEGTLLVAIGDVVGHGARAATWMGKLRAIVQFCALDGLGPAATLTRLDHFCQTLPGGDLATALIGHYDAARHRLTFASAGHPPPLLRTAGTARPGLSWAGRGPVLGAAPDSAFEEATVAIEPGSVMVLYTDGLVERRTESIDTGFARLLAVVGDGTGGLEPLADRIIEETLEHDQPADDVAMLVLRAGGSGAGLRLELSRDPRELAALRARLRPWLCETGATGDEIEELMIAVNELAANAIEHPGPQSQDRFEVVGDAAGNEVMIAVSDRGSWRPPSGATDERGRGLELAREFSDALTVDASSDRTTVRIRRHLSRPVTSAR